MDTPLLGAALIVKNEEAALPRCLDALNALRPLLGEVCVYDTGSSDATVEVAENRGARVERGYWDDDFSRARNAAIAMTTARWVVIVDADEAIRADVPALEAQLRRALRTSGSGLDAIQIQVNDIRAGGRFEQSWSSRRFLRPSRAHYANAVHEDIVSRRPGRPLAETKLAPEVVVLDHFGYTDDEAMREKTARNLVIADREVARLEGDVTRQGELVRALVDRARSARDQSMEEAAVADLRRVQATSATSRYRTWGLEMLADVLIDLTRYDDATDVIRELRTEPFAEPSFCDWLEARRDLTMGRVELGMQRLRTIDVLVSSSGVEVAPHVLLDARKQGAIHLGAYDEAAVCLIRLMAGCGHTGNRSAELLLALWAQLPRDVLVDMLLDADRGHLEAVIAEFDAFDAGREIGAALRRKKVGAVVSTPAHPDR